MKHSLAIQLTKTLQWIRRSGREESVVVVLCSPLTLLGEERSERLVPAFNPFLFFLPSLPLLFRKILCEGELFSLCSTPILTGVTVAGGRSDFITRFLLRCVMRRIGSALNTQTVLLFLFLPSLLFLLLCTILVFSRKTFLPPDSSLIHDTHTHTLHLSLSFLHHLVMDA